MFRFFGSFKNRKHVYAAQKLDAFLRVTNVASGSTDLQVFQLLCSVVLFRGWVRTVYFTWTNDSNENRKRCEHSNSKRKTLLFAYLPLKLPCAASVSNFRIFPTTFFT